MAISRSPFWGPLARRCPTCRLYVQMDYRQGRSSPDYTRRVRRSSLYPEIALRRRSMEMCITPIRMKLRLNIHLILR